MPTVFHDHPNGAFSLVIDIDRQTSQSPVKRMTYAPDAELLEAEWASGDGSVRKVYRYTAISYATFLALCQTRSLGGDFRKIVGDDKAIKWEGDRLFTNAKRVASTRRKLVPTGERLTVWAQGRGIDLDRMRRDLAAVGPTRLFQ